MSLRDTAIANFFAAVRNETIKSGTTLSQSELSAILGVSLSPLREALKLLEFQGFVKILPRSGVKIVESDMQRIKDCFQLRRILETAAIKRFVEFEQIKTLRPILQAHETLLRKIERQEPEDEILAALAPLDKDMHSRFIGALKNEIIRQVYDTNQDHILLFRLDSIALTYHGLKSTCVEHIAILESALRGDVDAAVRALDDHLLQTMHRAMAL
ncbi:MAG: GntR family transcriptional regulator [Sphingomonadales bacterium]|nr:GntR family transcriptional regulator [Sphingomonadales bacterium]